MTPFLKWSFLKTVSPSIVTILGLIAGLLIPFCLAWHFSFSAFFLLLISGFLDTLDGSLARNQALTSDKGAALDIISDRIVEIGVVLGLYLYDPSRAFLSILILGAMLICVTSFLVVGVFTQNDSEKSFHYSPGLIERAEAFIFFALLILFPSFFIPLATLFAALMLFTAFHRSYQFISN